MASPPPPYQEVGVLEPQPRVVYEKEPRLAAPPVSSEGLPPLAEELTPEMVTLGPRMAVNSSVAGIEFGKTFAFPATPPVRFVLGSRANPIAINNHLGHGISVKPTEEQMDHLHRLLQRLSASQNCPNEPPRGNIIVFSTPVLPNQLLRETGLGRFAPSPIRLHDGCQVLCELRGISTNPTRLNLNMVEVILYSDVFRSSTSAWAR